MAQPTTTSRSSCVAGWDSQVHLDIHCDGQKHLDMHPNPSARFFSFSVLSRGQLEQLGPNSGGTTAAPCENISSSGAETVSIFQNQ